MSNAIEIHDLGWRAGDAFGPGAAPVPAEAAGLLGALAVLLLSGAAATFLVGRWRVTE